MPGSVSGDDLEKVVRWLKRNRVILEPEEFLDGLNRDTLGEKHVVLSFDDTLRCQVDIAAPVLESENLKAVFNVSSSIFEGELIMLEIYARFRAKFFPIFEDFWTKFIEVVDEVFPGKSQGWFDDFPEQWLIDRKFYSRDQRIFRYVRDTRLSQGEYSLIMNKMIE